MISETEQKRHLVDLEFLQGTLKSAQVSTELITASKEFPLSFLTGNVPDDNKDMPSIFQMMYIPGDDLEEIALLQFYFFLTKPFSNKSISTINELLPKINANSVIGHFALDISNKLYYRYVNPLSRYSVPKEAEFLEIFSIAMNTFSSLSTLLIQLEQEEKTKEDIISLLPN